MRHSTSMNTTSKSINLHEFSHSFATLPMWTINTQILAAHEFPTPSKISMTKSGRLIFGNPHADQVLVIYYPASVCESMSTLNKCEPDKDKFRVSIIGYVHIPCAYKLYVEETKQADLIAFTQVLLCYLVEHGPSILNIFFQTFYSSCLHI